jgi:hypothetical protein
MKLSKVDSLMISIEINGQSATIAAPDLIASLAATVGPKHWLEDLANGHLQLSHALHDQNSGDVGTSLYNWEDEDEGPELEALAGAIANAMHNLRQTGYPRPIDGAYGKTPAKAEQMPGTISPL